MWTETIEIPGPYNFDFGLNRLAMDPLHKVSLEERSIKLPIYLREKEVAIIQAIGTTETPKFIISGQNVDTRAIVLKEVFRIFQWDKQLHLIHEHFTHTNLKEVFMDYRGTPIVLDFALHANLFKAIIHQQIHMSLAISITADFVHTYGEEVDGVPFYPNPEVIAQLTIEDLTALRLTKRRAEYIIGLSKQLANGEIELSHLVELEDEDVVKYLTKIRGIGPWTAQNFLLFALGRNNVFPATDIGIQRAAQNILQLEQKPSLEEMKIFSAAWKPYLSFATLYLWRSIEVQREKRGE